MFKLEKIPYVQDDFRYLTSFIDNGLNLCRGKKSKLLNRIKI